MDHYGVCLGVAAENHGYGYVDIFFAACSKHALELGGGICSAVCRRLCRDSRTVRIEVIYLCVLVTYINLELVCYRRPSGYRRYRAGSVKIYNVACIARIGFDFVIKYRRSKFLILERNRFFRHIVRSYLKLIKSHLYRCIVNVELIRAVNHSIRRTNYDVEPVVALDKLRNTRVKRAGGHTLPDIDLSVVVTVCTCAVSRSPCHSYRRKLIVSLNEYVCRTAVVIYV